MANVLGIEITQSHVRAALVRVAARRREPLRYLEAAIEPLGEEGSRDAAVQVAVREVLEGAGDLVDATYLALPGQHISLRTVTIPAAAAKRASEVLPFELESALPFSAEEAVIDHQPVHTRGGEMTLLAAATPEGAVEQELATLEAQGLSPRGLAPGATSLDGLRMSLAEPGDAWVIAHVEDDHTELCVMRNDHCELARTLDEGLSTADASPGALRLSLMQTLGMYRAEGGPAPKFLVVSGSGAAREGFAGWLGDIVQLPVESLQLPAPEGGLPGPVTHGKAYSLAVRWATTGRERRLNMRQGRFAADTGAGFVRRHAALFASCTAALVLAYVFSIWSEYSVLSDERDLLAEQLFDRSQTRLGEGTRSARRARELLGRVGDIDDPLPEFDAVQALGVISDAVSTDIRHQTRRLEIQLDDGGGEGSFELSGSVPDLASRDTIAGTLEEHPCIRELEKGRTSSLPGKDEKSYTLEGKLTCDPTADEGKGKGKGKGKGNKRRSKS